MKGACKGKMGLTNSTTPVLDHLRAKNCFLVFKKTWTRFDASCFTKKDGNRKVLRLLLEVGVTGGLVS
jgi:hypothetical protein